MTPGLHPSPPGARRDRVIRTLVAGVFLLLELPLLLPLIVGAGMTFVVVQVGALARRLRRG